MLPCSAPVCHSPASPGELHRPPMNQQIQTIKLLRKKSQSRRDIARPVDATDQVTLLSHPADAELAALLSRPQNHERARGYLRRRQGFPLPPPCCCLSHPSTSSCLPPAPQGEPSVRTRGWLPTASSTPSPPTPLLSCAVSTDWAASFHGGRKCCWVLYLFSHFAKKQTSSRL